MVLAYYGIFVNDMDLINLFGYNPRSKNIEENSWDDPDKMFVGFVDVQGSTSGYGVYSSPVIKVIHHFDRVGEEKTKFNAGEFAREIKNGYPIMMWGYTSITAPPYFWNTVDKEGDITGTVKAFRGEHVRLIVGFRGSVEDPEGFYVHDSLSSTGYNYWSREKLSEQFYRVVGVTDQAIVIK